MPDQLRRTGSSRTASLRPLLALLLPICLHGTAWAGEYQPINYFGFSYMQLSDRGDGPDYRPNGVVGRLGFMMSDNLGLELQAGLSQGGGGIGLNSVTAAYLYASLPYERLRLFTLAGMARTDVNSATSSEVTQNFSFGFGIRWQMMQNLDVGLEWMNYAERPAYRVGAFNIGVARHF